MYQLTNRQLETLRRFKKNGRFGIDDALEIDQRTLSSLVKRKLIDYDADNAFFFLTEAGIEICKKFQFTLIERFSNVMLPGKLVKSLAERKLQHGEDSHNNE